MEIENKLKQLGYALPPAPAPVANYVRAVQTGNLVYMAGQVPVLTDGSYLHVGKLGSDVTVEEGYACSRLCIINSLAGLKLAIGDLDRVTRIVKLLAMINCAPDFGQTPQVANGASDLLVELYGESGRHARSAVGMGSLPDRVPVEIEMIVEVRD